MSAVHNTVICRNGQLDNVPNVHDPLDRSRFGVHIAHRENRHLRTVDDRRKSPDPKAAEVRHSERGAGHVRRRKSPGAGTLRETPRDRGGISQRQGIRIVHDRNEQRLTSIDRHTDVDFVVVGNGIRQVRRIESRVFRQSNSDRPENHVVVRRYRSLVADLRGESSAELYAILHIRLDTYDKRRH